MNLVCNNRVSSKIVVRSLTRDSTTLLASTLTWSQTGPPSCGCGCGFQLCTRRGLAIPPYKNVFGTKVMPINPKPFNSNDDFVKGNVSH